MVTLHGTELRVSPVCLGADTFGWRLTEEQAFEILDRFSACGGNFIDTANIYGRWQPHGLNSSEIVLGKWLRHNREKSPVIATKGCHYELSTGRSRLNRACLQADLDSSLRALGVEAIALYYLHRDDLSMEIGEILELLEEFVRAGKILYYGASNFTAERLYRAEAYAKQHRLTGFSAVSNQYAYAKNNLTPLEQGDPTLVVTTGGELQFHRETKTPLVPYQATARGYFAKRARGDALNESLVRAFQSPENERKYESLLEESRRTGLSVQTLSLVRLARSEAFQLIPVTSVSGLPQLKDVEDALQILSE